MKARRTTAPHNRFHAVEVRPGAEACSSAQVLAGRLHLSSETLLKLPTMACTQSDDCSCRFVHHADRRSLQRRRGWGVVKIDEQALAQGRSPDQIRQSRGRRKSD